jgi:hypothetical protein
MLGINDELGGGRTNRRATLTSHCNDSKLTIEATIFDHVKTEKTIYPYP